MCYDDACRPLMNRGRISPYQIFRSMRNEPIVTIFRNSQNFISASINNVVKKPVPPAVYDFRVSDFLRPPPPPSPKLPCVGTAAICEKRQEIPFPMLRFASHSPQDPDRENENWLESPK